MGERIISTAVKEEMLEIIKQLPYDSHTIDKLEGIFALQKDYQESTYKLKMYPTTVDERIYKLMTAIIHEATEVQRLTRSLKWWKVSTPLLDDSKENQQKVKEELIDIYHFLVHASIEAKMTAKDTWSGYYTKNATNRQRVRDAY